MSREHVITILRRGSGRRDNGPVKRFGRPRYLARRVKPGLCPPFPSRFDSLTQTVGVDDSVTYYFNDDVRVPSSDSKDVPYSVRDGDLLMFVMHLGGATVTMSAGWTKSTVGDFDVWWRYWHDGDPLTVTVSVTGTAYDPNNPNADNASYWDGFWLPVRNAREVADPLSNAAFTSGLGAQVSFAQVQTASEADLLLNFLFHSSVVSPSGTFLGSVQNTKADMSEFDSFQSGAIRQTAPGTLAMLMGSVEEKGPSGATTAVAPSAGDWTTLTLSLPRLKPTPSEPVTGNVAGPETAPLHPGFLRPDDILLWSSFNATPPEGAGWHLLPGFLDSSSGNSYGMWWRRWKAGDSPDWGPTLADYFFDQSIVPQISVIRNASTRDEWYHSVTISGDESDAPTSPAVQAPSGALAIVVTQSAGLPLRFKYDSAPLVRYENQVTMTSYAAVASGYVPDGGLIPTLSVSATGAGTHPWVSTVIVVRRR